METVKVIKKINDSCTIEATFEERSMKDNLLKAAWLINMTGKCGKCGKPTSLNAREAKTTDGKPVTYVENVCTDWKGCGHKQIAGEYQGKGGAIFFRNEWVAPYKASA
jgi:hypothetical protein